MTWLKKHNPEIDFTTSSVKLTCCSPHCCTGCQDEGQEERHASKAQARVINACCTGPFPAFVEDTDDKDDDDQVPELEGFVEYEYEEGDRIWAASIPPAPEYICATASVSQRLAEAFQKTRRPGIMKNTSQSIFMDSMTCSPRTPSMNYQSPNPGIMPSNSFQKPMPLRVVRSTPCPSLSKRNLTPSSRRISTPVVSAHPNPQWPHPQ